MSRRTLAWDPRRKDTPFAVWLDRADHPTVSANTEGRSLGEVIADIKQRAAGLALPPGYR